jgi:ribose transport system permease protein
MSVKLRRLLREKTYLFSLILMVALFVANVIALPAFVSVDNWATNVATFAPFAVLAIASTPAILTGNGGIDLSIAPSANLANIVLVVELLPHATLSQPEIAIPIVLLMTSAIGLFNGFLVAVMRLPPVVATVGMLLLLLGLNSRVGPLPVPVTTQWVHSLNGSLGPVPWGGILIAIPLVIWSLTRLTPFHRTLYLVGGNQATAFSAGVNVTAVRMIAYTFGGLFAGIGGLALTAVFQTSDPNIGFQYSLIALAAVALGGTPLGVGGRGGVLGSLLGAAVIYLLQNLLLVSHVSNVWLQLVYGALLVLGVVAGALVSAPPRQPRVRTAVAA